VSIRDGRHALQLVGLGLVEIEEATRSGVVDHDVRDSDALANRGAEGEDLLTVSDVGREVLTVTPRARRGRTFLPLAPAGSPRPCAG
jgi:hypothetical protein